MIHLSTLFFKGDKAGMRNREFFDKLLSAMFCAVLVIEFFMNGSLARLGETINVLYSFDNSEPVKQISDIEKEYVNSLWKKKDLLNVYGEFARVLGMRSLFNRSGIFVTDDDYLVLSTGSTTTDYEYYETIEFNEFLEDRGINLLYVNEPTKYTEDSFFAEKFGVETYSNRNMDRFLERIKEAGVDTLDLRESMVNDNLEVEELFYRTDQHWTVPAGLWATRIIANELNERYDYDIDLSIYDENKYIKQEWRNCWLGELGRAVSESYIGLDDYTGMKPDFSTDFTFKNDDGTTYKGSFDDFVDEAVYNTNNDVYYNPSWHYSYDLKNNINNDVANGKVLLVCDSFGHVTQPFLSLGLHEVDWIILRDCDESFSLRDYVVENGYETVIIAYTQHMLGSHDNNKSSNYRMYTFDI